MMADLLMALGLVFVIEGLLYALVPAKLRTMMGAMQGLSDDQLRIGGLVAMAFGVVVVWLVRAAFF
jgi:uncharacterized protein YjeT (DUF2065 family)